MYDRPSSMDDCLEWAAVGSSQVASDTSVSLQNYSQHQVQLKPSSSLFMAAGGTLDSDSNCFALHHHGNNKIIGSISEGEDIFGSIQQHLQKKDDDPISQSHHHGNSDSDRLVVTHLFQKHFVGPALMDQSTHHRHVTSNSWKQEQILNNKLEADDDQMPSPTLTRSTDHHFVISSQLIDEPVIAHGYGIDNGTGGGRSCSRSMESLECLLSATNSNTDTSIEDDGISMIFSENCKSLWNAVVSSGEYSGCDDTSNNAKESTAVSQTSSQQYANQTRFSDATTTATAETLVKPAAAGLNYQYRDLIQSDSSTVEDGFQLISENPPKPKRHRSSDKRPSSSNINFQLQPSPSSVSVSVSSAGGAAGEPDSEAIAQMKEMIYRAAAFRPVNFGTEAVEKPKRKNVRISSDPQTVAARQRRERISERIRVLQRLVPGGGKMDTASMLDEAANYLKFLRSQVKALEALGHQKRGDQLAASPATNVPFPSMPFNHSFPMQSCFPLQYPNSSCIYQPKI